MWITLAQNLFVVKAKIIHTLLKLWQGYSQKYTAMFLWTIVYRVIQKSETTFWFLATVKRLGLINFRDFCHLTVSNLALLFICLLIFSSGFCLSDVIVICLNDSNSPGGATVLHSWQKWIWQMCLEELDPGVYQKILQINWGI